MPTKRRTVILIPGLLCDETVWQPIIEKLKPTLHVQIADLRYQASITEMALDIIAANNGPLYIAGHSMGARVAMEIARLVPDRLQKLALLDTGIHPLKEGELDRRYEIINFCNKEGMHALAKKWLPPMLHPDNHNNHDLLDRLEAMVLRMSPEIHERQITALINRPDASRYLPMITCPTVLIVGRQDLWSPVSQHEEMRQLLSNSKLEIIENSGHFAPLEKPKEVSNLLYRWYNA